MCVFECVNANVYIRLCVRLPCPSTRMNGPNTDVASSYYDFKSLALCMSVCLSDCLSVCLSTCLPTCLSVYLPAFLSAYLPVCLSASFSCLGLSFGHIVRGRQRVWVSLLTEALAPVANNSNPATPSKKLSGSEVSKHFLDGDRGSILREGILDTEKTRRSPYESK